MCYETSEFMSECIYVQMSSCMLYIHTYVCMYGMVCELGLGNISIYVTRPEKTGLIYIKYTYSYYGAYLSFSTLYFNSVSFNEQRRICCTCDKICIIMLSSQFELFNFKNSKFGQISHVDKTCFLRPGHISSISGN